MLNEKILREKVNELNEQKLTDSIEWTDEGMDYMVKEISTKNAKLYVNFNHVWYGVLIVER